MGLVTRSSDPHPMGAVTWVSRSRLRIGLEVPHQWLWRDRALYHREQASVVRPRGDSISVFLLGRTRGSPLLGDASLEWSGPVEMDPEDSDPLLGVADLAMDDIADDALLRYETGELRVLGIRIPDPTSATGLERYRYEAGDTMQVDLPRPARVIAVEAHPRTDGPNATTAILWFDAETHELLHMVLRPQGTWPLQAELSGPARAVPFASKRAHGSIRYLSVEYAESPEGIRVPRTVTLEGQILWLGNRFSMPVRVEWTADWSEGALEAVREIPPLEPDSAAEALVPPPVSVGWEFGLPRNAVNPFVRRLDRIAPGPPPLTLPALAVATLGSLRYNQVQGLSASVRYPYPVGRRSVLSGELRVGTTSFQPTGTVAFRQDVVPLWWGFEGYSRLDDANRWDSPLGLWNSFEALVLGQDVRNYYLATGAALLIGGENRPLTWDGSAYYERHSEARRLTDFSFFGGGSSSEADPTEIVADPGDIYGLRSEARLQWGDDPQVGGIVLRGAGELAFGDFTFQDMELMLDLVTPAPGPLAVAFRAAGGVVAGDVPSQRLFYLGGRKTVRGFQGNSARGAAYALFKGEVGTGAPVARVVAFADVGWAGEYSTLFDEDPLVGVGVGISLLDGVARIDVGRGVLGGQDLRLHFYTSGIF